MLIQLKKGKDGRSTLSCVRDDGTRTWGKLHPFFPEHDLTHFAVEGVLGFTEAFFGLVRSGWQLDDFSMPGLRARLPEQAVWAESIVGLLDLERGMHHAMSAQEFNTALGDSLGAQAASAHRRIEEREPAAIRALRGQLVARWRETDPGETLDVRFPPPIEAR